MPEDRSKITFSQAAGIEPLPRQFALGEMSSEFRAVLWKYVHDELWKSVKSGMEGGYLIGRWDTALKDLHVYLEHRPIDEYPARPSYQIDSMKQIIMQASYNKIFDVLQYIMRHPAFKNAYKQDFRDGLKGRFQYCRVAYTIVDEGPTIVPAATEEEGNTITKAFADLSGDRFAGARKHLRQAAEELNAGRGPDSIRESIHAVESVARVLDPKSNNNLSSALDQLECHAAIHPALKAAFEKLYGFTSNEKGIRHPLLEDGKSKVDHHDSQFMIGACASFVSYLVGKARASGMIPD